MYFVLYDRFLNSIGDPYVLESWSRTQRAVDLDSIRIEGELIPFSADPFFVVINDRQGKPMFSGLASTPIINNKTKKTSIILKDYCTLFNSDIIINQANFTGTSLADYVDFVLTLWRSQTEIGFSGITWDVSGIVSQTISHARGEASNQNLNVYNHIFGLINYYDLYIDCALDIHNKSLSFTFLRSGLNPVSVKLSDFGVDVIEKSFGDYNRATVYNHKYERKFKYALSTSNNIVLLKDLVPSASLVFPAKNRNFIAEEPREDLTENDALQNALYDAVMGLAENRYQENIDLDAQKYKSLLDLTTIDFSYRISVYTDEGYYKDLPVGEIVTDSRGNHVIRLGHRVQELTQEI